MWYAVHKGKETGVFANWEQVKPLVIGYPGAKYKKFNSLTEARAFAAVGNLHNQLVDTITVGKKQIHVVSSDTVAKNTNFDTLYHDEQPQISVKKKSHAPKTKYPRQERVPAMTYIKVYTDGACRDNQDRSLARSSFGVFFSENDENNAYGMVSGHPQTNNRAELYAILKAFQIYKEKFFDKNVMPVLCIYTDSIYSLNCIKSWIPIWKKRNWYKSNGEKVENQDLLKKLDVHMQKYPLTQIYHVYGHSNDVGNEEADALANRALDEYEKSIEENRLVTID